MNYDLLNMGKCSKRVAGLGKFEEGDMNINRLVILVVIGCFFCTAYGVNFINCTPFMIYITRNKRKQTVRRGMVGDLGKNGTVYIKVKINRSIDYNSSINVSKCKHQTYCLEWNEATRQLFFVYLNTHYILKSQMYDS
jgi:hypothetical protein